MAQKKKIVSKLFLLVLLLTIISSCFLGSTFARYTTTKEGTASLTVAKWAINLYDSGGAAQEEFAVTFDKLSPSKEGYVDTVRTHSTGKKLVAVLQNKGDVEAYVTFGDAESTEKIVKAVGDEDWGDYSEETIKGLFEIKLYKGTSATVDTDTTPLAAQELAVNEAIYIFAEVIWTSDDESVTGTDADLRDTWVGENVASVQYTLSYTAVQHTEIPADNI